MAAGETMAQLLADRNNPTSDLTDVIYGIVTSANPLKIKVENRYEVGGKFLVLTKPVKEYKRDVFVNVPEHGMCKGYCVVFEALKAGEKVIMIKAQKGQKYIVLDREE